MVERLSSASQGPTLRRVEKYARQEDNLRDDGPSGDLCACDLSAATICKGLALEIISCAARLRDCFPVKGQEFRGRPESEGLVMFDCMAKRCTLPDTSTRYNGRIE